MQVRWIGRLAGALLVIVGGLAGCALEPEPAGLGVVNEKAMQGGRVEFGGESHFQICENIDVDDQPVDCLGLHACKSPLDHVLACFRCDERFGVPGLDECPDGPWDDTCHAVDVRGRKAPFDCRDLDRCDPDMLAERMACGACDPRYNAPRPDDCAQVGGG